MDALPSHCFDQIMQFGSHRTIIATDTETSGLFADDGARTSTSSIAWEAPPEDGWQEWANRFDNITYGIETIAEGYEVYIASVAWPFDQGTEGPPIKPEDTGQPSLFTETPNLDQGEWESLLNLLMEQPLDMHHSKFDSEKYRVGVRRWPGIGQELQDSNVVWDTQNVNHLIYPTMKDPKTGSPTTSLKPSCQVLFGQEWADEAAVVKKYLAKKKLPAGRWDLIPWDIIHMYADTDARLTYMLMLRQQYDIDNKIAGTWLGSPDDVYAAIERRLKTTHSLYHMERRGVPYDEVGSTEAAMECRARAIPIEEELPFGPTGDKAKKFFFGDGKSDKGVECLNLVPYALTEKNAPSLTAEITTRMVADRVPYAKEWAEWSKVDNAASMWYEAYAARTGTDGRLRCAFRQNGTRSSRFSVERINLQAIPQDYRLSDHTILDGIPTPRALIANAVPLGWRLYELDLEQAELRVGSSFAGCERMLNMIRQGTDLHTYTTKELFPNIVFQGPDWDKYRQVGKRGNFSLQFGSGGPTFKNMVSKETGIILGDAEADRIVRDWNDLYPEFKVAIKRHMRRVEKRQSQHGHGWIEFANGERRWFAPFEESHKAFNQRVQGTLAQFGIDWLLLTDPFLMGAEELQERAKADGIGEPGLVLTIHDSQLLLLPDDAYGRQLAEQCANFGRDLWKEWFPDVPGGVDFHRWDRTNTGGIGGEGSYVGDYHG